MSSEETLDLAAARIIAAQHGYQLVTVQSCTLSVWSFSGYRLIRKGYESSICATLAEVIEILQKGGK